MVQKVIIGLLVLVVVVLTVPIVARVLKGTDVATQPQQAQAAEAPQAQTPAPQPQTAVSAGEPQVVSMVPANGATGVSPSLDKLIVVFDRPMGGGFSWTGGGPQMPDGAGRPSWAPDRKTCVLPVRLKPNWNYRLGLNSPSHRNFQSAEGIPLQRVTWTFSTGQ